MKKLFLILVSFPFLISCNNSKKYEGKWTNWFLKDYGYNETKSVFIKNDSIKFNYTYFDFWNKYPLTIEKRKLNFNNIALNVSIEKDTLTLNDSIHFVKDKKDTLYGYKPILKINLPQLAETISISKKDDDIINYIYFGKRLDNGKFGLQLNDKYAEISELPEFLHYTSCGGREELIPFHTTYIFTEKSTPMKYLEDIFCEFKKVNQLKVCLVNDIQLKYNDSLGLYYEYERLTKKLPPFREHDYYQSNTSADRYQTPPPPPLYYPESDDKNPIIKVILLKNNSIYFKDDIVETDQLKNLIKPWIKENNIILSLYDLESHYSSFLEMNAIINLAYQEVREEKSKIKFNKALKVLTREELTEIKTKTPMMHSWDYSIPHFNRIVEKEGSFYGLEIKPIK